MNTNYPRIIHKRVIHFIILTGAIFKTKYSRSKGKLTLCFDSVADGARVTQAVRISRSHQEQVDAAGLQTLQNEALCLHVIRERLPAAARRMAAVHTTQIKCQFTLRPNFVAKYRNYKHYRKLRAFRKAQTWV